MEKVTVSSKGQIAIPKAVRDAMNLSEGAKLTVQRKGQTIVLSKDSAWKKLHGAAPGRGMMTAFAAFKRREREREDSGR